MKARLSEYTQGEAEFMPESGGIFPQVLVQRPSFNGHGMAQNGNAIYLKFAWRILIGSGRDDGNFVAVIAKGTGDAPDAVVEWHGQVFDNDQDMNGIRHKLQGCD